MKTVKIHSNNKPWVNSKITKLIKLRQKAFTPHRTAEWRQLRNNVQREISKAKTNYYANRVLHLQKTDPRKWHQQVKVMTNNNKSEVSIPIPGVKDSDHVSIANVINDRFVSVSDHLCPLDIAQLKPFFLHLRHHPLFTHGMSMLNFKKSSRQRHVDLIVASSKCFNLQ